MYELKVYTRQGNMYAVVINTVGKNMCFGLYISLWLVDM